MNLEKMSIVELSNGKKIIILEKIEYNGVTYLYVDDVTNDESNTLDNYYIMKLNSNNTLSRENNPNILTEILPIFSGLVKENYSEK